ncbi:hypothetical protein EJV47_21030 [Hymenobacter gummosus]|uniref:STAS/SEC14 domain-containing protein n=1 Tax=Hymenobacter gummosus TaxID=1776032 RepID=A0A431TY48_9BACT|nr:STAS/SEC14 domain-containing protein [Hymenobacter gummosus]RTQ46857.1 hypothetical protein EJV47_21030 [Hymenobacter gummosus]
MDVLYDTPPLSIYLDRAHHWLYVEWKGNHTAASARSGGELILQHLRSCACHKMLNDNSQVTSEWEAGARWVGSEYYQQLARLGMRHVAWVCPPDWGARRSMELAMQFVTRPVVVLFDDVASAYSWLARQR